MVLRWMGLLLAAVQAAACTNIGAEPDFGGPSIVAKGPSAAPSTKQQGASLAASVLAGVALERVTGRPPAPIAGAP
jgi:hypothetical protein